MSVSVMVGSGGLIPSPLRKQSFVMERWVVILGGGVENTMNGINGGRGGLF